MIAAPFTGSLQTAVQVQTGSGQWANGIRLLNKAAPAANAIRPFVRPIAPVLGTALLGKVALVAGAFAVGYGIGTLLKDALLKPKIKPIDTSQPSKPEVERQPTEVSFEVPYNASVFATYAVETRQTYKESSRFKCSNNDQVEVGSTTETLNTYEIKKAYGFRYSTAIATAKLVCSGGTGDWVNKTILLIEKADADGNWSTEVEVEGKEGTASSQFYYDGVDEKSFGVLGVEQDEVPLIIPAPYIEPVPEPLPEVEPETLPSRVLPPAPVIAPPLPGTLPGEPLSDPERLAPPITIPAPAVPATAPAVQPAQAPTTTNETTNAGEIVPSKKPPVPTTPKDVHKIGNAGGRIAGRTMRPTPVGIAQEVGRIEQKISQMNRGFPTLGGLGDILRLLLGLNELLNSQKGGTTYELKSVCECPSDEENCEEETTTVSTGGGYYVDEILARIDAIPPLLQAHKDYKQPICNEKPELEGDFRTISFISDERTTAGDRYLSKRFRYRSQSGADLDTLVDHWKDFQWNAGPVCVQHSGHSWGTPQVWAATSDEGKRVIQHAGREAGIDPSEVGKWTVSGSNNPRFGLSGRMRVNTRGGYYWITERLGSDQRPLVART